MTRLTRVSLTTAIVLAGSMGLAATAHAQQFGPPQQSLYAHNPGSAPTYVKYNQYVPSVPATPVKPAPSAASHTSTPAKHTPATRNSAAAHPVTIRKKTTASPAPSR